MGLTRVASVAFVGVLWSLPSPSAPGRSDYEITRAATGWHAANPSVGLDFDLDGRGLRVIPRGGASWSWGLTLRHFGREDALRPVPEAGVEMQDARAERPRHGLVEWYVNDRRGIEHGVTVATRPPGTGELLVELDLLGSLSPTFTSDGLAVDFRGPDGRYVLRYGQLEVIDATGRKLPARMEGLAADGGSILRIRCDDADAVYPVTIDPLVTTAAWSVESNLTNTYFGQAIRTAGDVNGDGYSDVIVASSVYSNGHVQEGKVFIYYGSPSGPSVSADWSLEGEQTVANYGANVTTAGDVNGDGYHDVLVSAPGMDHGETDEGQVFLYHGSAAGLQTTPAWSVEGNASFRGYGDAIAAAGDVNNDGFGDVLIGTSCDSNGQPCEGIAHLYLGSAAGLAAAPAWVAEGNQANAYFGTVSGAGDVNGDGYADVVIGAWGYTNGQQEEGVAFIYHGNATGLEATPARTLEANQIFAQFGVAVGTAGDVNGDGYADVIVGAPNYANGQAGEGAAFLYKGSATGIVATPVWTFEGNQAPTPGFTQGTTLGCSVGTAGDVNGDGLADLIVGARFYDAPTRDEGKVFVFTGHRTFSFMSTPALELESDQLDSAFGANVATAGDVNGDGFSDVLVSSHNFDNPEINEGRVFLYLGAGGVPRSDTSDSAWAGGVLSAHLGWSVASAGDIRGDGHPQVLAGAPDYTDAFTRQGKVTLYHNGGILSPIFPGWTVVGSQADEAFGESVAGAGDVNGDGRDDVIVGAPGHTASLSKQGKVAVYLGGVFDPDTTPAWTLLGGSVNAYLGECVAAAGDVNGDGYGDVLVAGRNSPVSLFLGGPTGLALTPAWQQTGLASTHPYFPIVASAGDVNRDGYSDVLVTAPADSQNGIIAGAAHLFLGSPAGLAATPQWTARGTEAFALFGAAAASAGDVNGDGYADVVIGAPGTVAGGTGMGYAYVYLGSAAGLQTTLHRVWETDYAAGSDLGMSVGTAGDVNADGYSDLLIGSPSADSGGFAENGRATIYLGSAAGVGATPAWTWSPPFPNFDRFGQSAASAGDVNGDGFADVWIGAPTGQFSKTQEGTVHLFLGGGRLGIDRVATQQLVSGGGPISLRGRSDVEFGFRIFQTGHTAAGRGKIRLHWEAKPIGVAFTGSGTGYGFYPLADTSAPDGAGSKISYNRLMGGIPEGTMVHWRVRNSSDNPFFPRTPWISPFGAVATGTMFRTAGCIDRDADGYGALVDPSCTQPFADCNDQAGTLWGTPGVTTQLVFLDKTTLSWLPPSNPGSSSPVYDTLRGTTSVSFGFCAETGSPDTATTDPTVPVAGQRLYYVTRARNACPAGVGSLGSTSAGNERSGLTCP